MPSAGSHRAAGPPGRSLIGGTGLAGAAAFTAARDLLSSRFRRPGVRHPGARAPMRGTGSATKARFILTLII